MKALSIGNDEQTTEMASLSLRIRWPDCAIHIAKTLEEGLRALRHQSFDVLILHSRTDHVPLSRIVKEVRQLSDLPPPPKMKEDFWKKLGVTVQVAR